MDIISSDLEKELLKNIKEKIEPKYDNIYLLLKDSIKALINLKE